MTQADTAASLTEPQTDSRAATDSNPIVADYRRARATDMDMHSEMAHVGKPAQLTRASHTPELAPMQAEASLQGTERVPHIIQ